MPYMRVARSRADPATTDEERQVLQEVIAATKRQPGCQSIVVGVDRTSGHTLIVSLWDTAEHARFSRDALGGEVLSKIQAIGGRPDPPEFFEVTSQA
jgi:quinol monooxygenase YgiN